MRKHYNAIMSEENHVSFILGLKELERKCNVNIEENAELNYLSNAVELFLQEKLETTKFKKATKCVVKNVSIDVTFEIDSQYEVIPQYFFVVTAQFYDNENIFLEAKITSDSKQSLNIEDFTNAFLKSLKIFEEKSLAENNEN